VLDRVQRIVGEILPGRAIADLPPLSATARGYPAGHRLARLGSQPEWRGGGVEFGRGDVDSFDGGDFDRSNSCGGAFRFASFSFVIEFRGDYFACRNDDVVIRSCGIRWVWPRALTWCFAKHGVWRSPTRDQWVDRSVGLFNASRSCFLLCFWWAGKDFDFVDAIVTSELEQPVFCGKRLMGVLGSFVSLRRG